MTVPGVVRDGPEWDLVAQSVDSGRALLGEVKWREQPATLSDVSEAAVALLAKGVPPLRELRDKAIDRALFLPAADEGVPPEVNGVHVVVAGQVLEALR